MGVFKFIADAAVNEVKSEYDSFMKYKEEFENVSSEKLKKSYPSMSSIRKKAALAVLNERGDI